jgi:hypothetical protein
VRTSQLTQRLAMGESPPSAATQAVSLLAQYSRAYEVGVLEQRVSDLERAPADARG